MLCDFFDRIHNEIIKFIQIFLTHESVNTIIQKMREI